MPTEDSAEPIVLVVDIANVMGSRPDGWWRDRAGAATRLMTSLGALLGATIEGPDSGADAIRADAIGADAIRLTRIVAVIEGRARTAVAPAELEVVAAPADGDTTIVAVAQQVSAQGGTVLVVTADRGLRARLPAGTRIAGPRWLLDRLPA